jgi:hypothetical protein
MSLEMDQNKPMLREYVIGMLSRAKKLWTLT